MGSNRRYAKALDRRMDERILERLTKDGPLQTLTDQEIDLANDPITKDPNPKPVKAWVRFGNTPVLVDAEACQWTPDAIAIRFKVGEREYRTWVWSSAVRLLEQHPPATAGS